MTETKTKEEKKEKVYNAAGAFTFAMEIIEQSLKSEQQRKYGIVSVTKEGKVKRLEYNDDRHNPRDVERAFLDCDFVAAACDCTNTLEQGKLLKTFDNIPDLTDEIIARGNKKFEESERIKEKSSLLYEETD